MSENLDDETGTILASADSDDSKSIIPKEKPKVKVEKNDDTNWETNTEDDDDSEW